MANDELAMLLAELEKLPWRDRCAVLDLLGATERDAVEAILRDLRGNLAVDGQGHSAWINELLAGSNPSVTPAALAALRATGSAKPGAGRHRQKSIFDHVQEQVSWKGSRS